MRNCPYILLVNDDGLSAPGLKFMSETLKDFANIIVVAPSKEQSGMSHAISVDKKLKLKKLINLMITSSIVVLGHHQIVLK